MHEERHSNNKLIHSAKLANSGLLGLIGVVGFASGIWLAMTGDIAAFAGLIGGVASLILAYVSWRKLTNKQPTNA